MEFCVACIKRQYHQSARKTERGLIVVLAECFDKATSDYISAMFQEKGIDAFVYGFKEGLTLQEKYTIIRASINNI